MKNAGKPTCQFAACRPQDVCEHRDEGERASEREQRPDCRHHRAGRQLRAAHADRHRSEDLRGQRYPSGSPSWPTRNPKAASTTSCTAWSGSLNGESYRLKDRDLGPRPGRQSAEIA